MSAHRDENLAVPAVRNGAQDYLMKGQVTIESLARSIQYGLERHRLLHSIRGLSLVDDLTGLYNRRGFHSLGSSHLHLAQRACRRFEFTSPLKIEEMLAEADRALYARKRGRRSTTRIRVPRWTGRPSVHLDVVSPRRSFCRMHPDEFRRHAHELVDWMADYLRDVGTMPITPAVAPGDIRRQIPAAPPLDAEPFDALFDDFRRVIVPGMTHWNHPGWFAYFPCNNSPPSILGEMLTATIGAQGMSWATSPAATELEQVVMDWLRQMMDLPQGWVGVIQDTASTATLVALLTARERATGGGTGRSGLAAAGTPLTVYASREAHSSIDKAVKLAGYGLEHLRSIETDAAFALRPDALARALEADHAAGLRPACVVASVGTTSSTAIDPLVPIAELCRRYGAWLHVDAAYAGAAAIVPELRPMFQGMEEADSIVFNPHKWLLTNFDCTAYFVRDPSALLATFQTTPEYLRTAYDADVVNFRDWGIQLGRRFRALKLWFVIRSYGVEGLRAIIRRHVSLAQELAQQVAADPEFELMAPVPFGLVCLRWCPAGRPEPELDALNARLLAAVNAGRERYLTHTRLGGRYAIRLVVGQRGTKREHVRAAWESIRQAAKELA